MEGTLSDLDGSFRLVATRKEALEFRHASDLIFFVDKQKAPESLYVIIDYLSFFNIHINDQIEDQGERYKEDEVLFSANKAAGIIRRAILKYPETMFFFDESWNQDKKVDFRHFLLKGKISDVSLINRDYHWFSVNEDDPFQAIKRDRSNLFDGSNLRYVIMRHMYDELKVDRYNFSIMQDSRAKHLALVIEEETAQNRFNSYCLYVNGFRVFPVLSAKELKKFNDHVRDNVCDACLLVRDFDLQFDDTEESKPRTLGVYECTNPEEKKHKLDLEIFTVDEIRRAKRVEKNEKGEKRSYWYILEQGDKKTCQKEISLEWIDGSGPYQNLYWSDLRNIETVYITKGPKNVLVKNDGSAFMQEDSAGHQIIQGLYKPVTGVYEPFRKFKTIKERSDEVMSYGKDDDDSRESKEQKYYINTDRKNHEHGVPLDIYDLVKAMVERARHYQRTRNYTLSAMVAWNAIEVMNGFHEQLMLQAYHIAATSENAIAMNVLGGDDTALKNDALFRIGKIKNDIERLLARKDSQENGRKKDLTQNILNQIFIDCRHYCKEKEHFGAESAFIGAVAHNSDGFKVSELVPSVRRKLARIKTIQASIVEKEKEAYKRHLMASISKIEKLTSFDHGCFEIVNKRSLGKRLEKLKKSYSKAFDEEAVSSITDVGQSLNLEQGDVIKIKLKKPSNSSFMGHDKIIWETSDERIATVKKGVVRALEEGEVIITATQSSAPTPIQIQIVVSRKSN